MPTRAQHGHNKARELLSRSRDAVSVAQQSHEPHTYPARTVSVSPLITRLTHAIQATHTPKWCSDISVYVSASCMPSPPRGRRCHRSPTKGCTLQDSRKTSDYSVPLLHNGFPYAVAFSLTTSPPPSSATLNSALQCAYMYAGGGVIFRLLGGRYGISVPSVD